MRVVGRKARADGILQGAVRTLMDKCVKLQIWLSRKILEKVREM